jgi:hypothetical protein
MGIFFSYFQDGYSFCFIFAETDWVTLLPVPSVTSELFSQE